MSCDPTDLKSVAERYSYGSPAVKLWDDADYFIIAGTPLAHHDFFLSQHCFHSVNVYLSLSVILKGS